MRVAVYSAKPYDKDFLLAANSGHQHEWVFLEPRLIPETVHLSAGAKAAQRGLKPR